MLKQGLADRQTTIEREFGNLASIRDNHEKVVISTDDMSFGNMDGIHHIPARDFVE